MNSYFNFVISNQKHVTQKEKANKNIIKSTESVGTHLNLIDQYKSSYILQFLFKEKSTNNDIFAFDFERTTSLTT